MKRIKKKNLGAWGNYPRVDAEIHLPEGQEELNNWIKDAPTFIPAGNFRSYGDAALQKNILQLNRMPKRLELDSKTGILSVSAAILFSEIIECCLAKKWFLPVTPGTKYISVGGAIAADIHGKNHHQDGCISNFLLEFTLLKADGSQIVCRPDQHADWFWATCSGMGLTGIILDAKIQMLSVETAYIKKETIATKNLDETIAALEAASDKKYSVAWFDAIAGGKNLGRGIVYTGYHAKLQELTEKQKSEPLKFKSSQAFSIPFFFPGFSLNRFTVWAFNKLYYFLNKRKAGASIESLNSFFYPLDGVQHWNRIYGRRGFVQYQCVIPKSAGPDAIRELMQEIQGFQGGSFLAVLKLMGPAQEKSPLHFPMEGYTLALDFPRSKKVLDFLNKLDHIVINKKGRLYLAKDATMNSSNFLSTLPIAQDFFSKYCAFNKIISIQFQRLRSNP